MQTSAPHSAAYFGRQRDFWWNADFFDLMARRWRLENARLLADIGCGIGHWHRLLFPYLAAGTQVTAIDREPVWLSRAAEEFHRRFPDASPGTLATLQADAASLPLAADQFDVVTCQTVLMHLRDPQAALREMVRIARPGGAVIAVEPNNFRSRLSFDSLTWTKSNDELVRRYHFWLCYHRGKIANGEGDDTLGDRLPGYFAGVGLTDIQVYQNDKAFAVFPPYATEEEQVALQQAEEWRENQTGPWDVAALRRHVLAGGGTTELFEQGLAELRRDEREELAAVGTGTFFASGGSATILVCGRKR